MIEPFYRNVALRPDVYYKVLKWAEHRDCTMSESVDWAFDNLGVPMDDLRDRDPDDLAATVDLKRKHEKENSHKPVAHRSYVAVIEAALNLAEAASKEANVNSSPGLWSCVERYRRAVRTLEGR